MVDESLLKGKDRKLRYLFLDLNSYFASVEQQEHPELRGIPMAVVPVEADSSFIIAASYEAKAFGIKTGTRIGDAKKMCPGIVLRKGNHTVYAAYHQRVIEAVETVLPVEEVCSIDEMRMRLLGEECEIENALQLARDIKQAIWGQVGKCLNCSIGIASNPFLSKIATELEKPNGLQVLVASELPGPLLKLRLNDFTGINSKMKARLNGAGIFSTEDLFAASERDLRAAFGSKIGARWWYLIRGYDIGLEQNHRRSMGHSHVLAPAFRNEAGVKQVLLRLLHKAASRLRASGLCCSEMDVTVKSFEKSWSVHFRFDPTQDTTLLTSLVLEKWPERDFQRPRAVAITFYKLQEPSLVTPSLFDSEEPDRTNLSKAVDSLNQKFGKNTVYLGGLHEAKETAPERLAFNKTWLFSEGKGDNQWDLPDASEDLDEDNE